MLFPKIHSSLNFCSKLEEIKEESEGERDSSKQSSKLGQSALDRTSLF